jgi:hypothetical protein
MKGFPNQVADLPKIATGMKCLVDIEAAGENGKDDGVFGEALVRAGVAGTGHTPRPIEKYLAEQRRKTASNQSFRTTARGLRELYRLMGLIDDSGNDVAITDLGRRAASFAGKPWDDEQIGFWRGVIQNIEHTDQNGTSHPYQVLLRLVARKPGITRAKCALALEAEDDSPKELNRIVALADKSEDDIKSEAGITPANWDNAKKVLPKFAEQLGDVIRGKGGTYVLADAPGRADAGPAEAASAPRTGAPRKAAAPRAPRSSREVTPDTIGKAGLAEKSDEVPIPPPGDPAAIAAAIKARGDRLKRHNLLVREFAALFEKAGAKLYEDPFDILALFEELGILVEVKSLDGSAPDERERVRDAFGQLLYYEGFLTAAVAGEAPIAKIACFESGISEEHRKWLNSHGVGVVWKSDGKLVGDKLARDFLSAYLKKMGGLV